MSDWRNGGQVSSQLWRSVIEHAGGPPELAGTAAWAAAGEHSALALAMLKAESSYGTDFLRNKPENRNPLNLRPPNGTGYMSYSSWVDGVQAWHDRITSPTYKNGIYAKTITLEELIHRYAPDEDDNNEAEYVRTIRTLWQSWGVTEEPMTELTFGKVPKPAHTDSHLDTSNPMIGYSNPAIVIEGVVWHRMIGTLWGTDGWFHAGKAATAYGVGVVSIDGQDDAGRIIEWIDPANGHYYGESSGPVSNPYGDGLKFVQRFGVGRVNPQTVAIEISGNYETPLDEPARAAIVNLTAYLADQRKIPWDQFPIVPGQDRSFVHHHQEFTIGTGKVCPGAAVMNETSALIQRVAGVLKHYQAGTVTPQPPQYAKPDLPEWFVDSLEQAHPGDQSEDGVKYYALRRNFVAKEPTRRLNKPGENPERSGPNLKLAEKVHGERYCVVGKERRILTNDGHYIAANKLSPPVKIG